MGIEGLRREFIIDLYTLTNNNQCLAARLYKKHFGYITYPTIKRIWEEEIPDYQPKPKGGRRIKALDDKF